MNLTHLAPTAAYTALAIDGRSTYVLDATGGVLADLPLPTAEVRAQLPDTSHMGDLWTVYRTSKIVLGRIPDDEVRVGGEHATAGEAMREANKLARADRKHSYTVGAL